MRENSHEAILQEKDKYEASLDSLREKVKRKGRLPGSIEVQQPRDRQPDRALDDLAIVVDAMDP